MPKYEVLKPQVWISHECRFAKQGDQFETVFPKAKKDGKEVDMDLGDTFKLLDGENEAKAKKA